MLQRLSLALAMSLSLLAAPVLQSATLPRKAPDFSVLLPNKARMPLSTYKGKVVILAFILTTCPHCQSFTRVLNKVQQDFGAKGLQVIASAVDEKPEPAIPGFIRSFQPPFPVGFNNFTDAVDFLHHPRQVTLHMPAAAFIDKEGTIVAQYQGTDDFMAELKVDQNIRVLVQKLLGPISPAKKALAKKKKA